MNRIEKNYNENRQKTYKKLIKRNIIERDNYINSLNKYIEKQKELSESKKEKAFKKAGIDSKRRGFQIFDLKTTVCPAGRLPCQNRRFCQGTSRAGKLALCWNPRLKAHRAFKSGLWPDRNGQIRDLSIAPHAPAKPAHSIYLFDCSSFSCIL